MLSFRDIIGDLEMDIHIDSKDAMPEIVENPVDTEEESELAAHMNMEVDGAKENGEQDNDLAEDEDEDMVP